MREIEAEPKFEPGDTVTWTSQAAGFQKAKTGKILFKVHAGESVKPILYAMVRDHPDKYSLPDIESAGVRKQDSYLVAVERGPKAKVKVYWPLTSLLKITGKSATAALAETRAEESIHD